MGNSSHLFIISNYKFKKHTTLDRAQRELDRLRKVFPDQYFRIYKVAAKIDKDGIKMKGKPKQDPSTDYKNPPWQKGPDNPEIGEKISLANFHGTILTKAEIDG